MSHWQMLMSNLNLFHSLAFIRHINRSMMQKKIWTPPTMWHKYRKIILAHLNVKKRWLALSFLFDLIVFYSDSVDPQKELSFLWVYHMHLLFSSRRTFSQNLFLAISDFVTLVLVIFTPPSYIWFSQFEGCPMYYFWSVSSIRVHLLRTYYVPRLC